MNIQPKKISEGSNHYKIRIENLSFFLVSSTGSIPHFVKEFNKKELTNMWIEGFYLATYLLSHIVLLLPDKR